MQVHRLIALAFALAALLPSQEPSPAMQRVLAMPVADSPDRGIPMTIHDGEAGGTIAGAIAVHLPDGWARRLHVPDGSQSPLPPLGERVLAIAADIGTRYHADTKGVVTVPHEDDRGCLIAVDGDRLAIDRVLDDAPVVVARSRLARVLVRDARGRPAGGVQLTVTTGRLSSIPLAITDEAGRAEIDVGIALGHFASGGTVSAMIPTKKAASAKIRDYRGAAPIAEIALPPCGHVRFVLYGPDEKPWPAVKSVRLRAIERADEGDQLAVAFDQNRSVAWSGPFMPPTLLEKDNATFRHVALGTMIEAEVVIKGIAGAVTFRGNGPTRPGELVILDGRVNTAVPVVHAAICDNAGKPLCNQELSLVMGDATATPPRSFQRAVRTDERGHIRIVWPDLGATGLYVLRLATTATGDTVSHGAVRIPVPQLEPGPHKLGRHTLQREPVVTTGRVVDSAGDPVAGLRIQVPRSTVIDSPASRGPSLPHVITTDGQGWFEIRELQPVPRLVVVRPQPGWDTSGAFVEHQRRGQIIQMDRLTNVSFALHDGGSSGIWNHARLNVAFVKPTGLVLHADTVNGKVSMPRIATGSHDVWFHSGHRMGKPTEQTGFCVKNVLVRSDGQTTPDLSTIDWSKHLRYLRMTVENHPENLFTRLGRPSSTARIDGDMHVIHRTRVAANTYELSAFVSRETKVLRIDAADRLVTKVHLDQRSEFTVRLQSRFDQSIAIRGLPALTGIRAKLTATHMRNDPFNPIGAGGRSVIKPVQALSVFRPKALGPHVIQLTFVPDDAVLRGIPAALQTLAKKELAAVVVRESVEITALAVDPIELTLSTKDRKTLERWSQALSTATTDKFDNSGNPIKRR